MLKIDCEIPLNGKRLPLWREIFWPAEWFALRSSDVYAGSGVPHGDGQSLVLVPGFLASDLSLKELHDWLERIGYRVHPAGLGRIDDCPDILLAKLLESVESTAQTTGHSVAIIGHSMGGTLARAAAIRRPDLISQVISLGSPVTGSQVSGVVLGLAQAIGTIRRVPADNPRQHGDHVHDGTCVCELADALAAPKPPNVSLASIFSKRDGVVDWQSSQEPAPVISIEANASHLGLAVNADVYRAIAWLLARRPLDRMILNRPPGKRPSRSSL